MFDKKKISEIVKKIMGKEKFAHKNRYFHPQFSYTLSQEIKYFLNFISFLNEMKNSMI